MHTRCGTESTKLRESGWKRISVEDKWDSSLEFPFVELYLEMDIILSRALVKTVTRKSVLQNGSRLIVKIVGGKKASSSVIPFGNNPNLCL